MFIRVLACQCVQFVPRRPQVAGIREHWNSLPQTLPTRPRLSAGFRQKAGRTLHVRKSTPPETDLAPIYRTLNVDHNPGGTQRFVA